MPLTEGPMCTLVKIGQAVSEKKTVKEYKILYMYKAHGARADNPGGQTFDCY